MKIDPAIKYKIHFVCSGNTYRSRVAEAYAKYKLLRFPKIVVTSSGVTASKNNVGSITWTALMLIQQNKLLKYMSRNWTQTSKDLLDKQDIVIFMDKLTYDISRKKYGFSKRNKHFVLDVGDTPYFDMLKKSDNIIDGNIKLVKLVHNKFDEIRNKLDDLFGEILNEN